MTLTSKHKHTEELLPGAEKARLFSEISYLINIASIHKDEATTYIEYLTSLNAEESKSFIRDLYADYGLDYPLNNHSILINDINAINKKTLQAIQKRNNVFKLDGIADDLKQLKEKYFRSGNKFGLFSQHSDREKTLGKCILNINTIQSKSLTIDKAQALAILEQLSRAIVETKRSHEANSFAGFLGLTESRLAKELSDYAIKIRDDFDISPDDVEDHIARSKQPM